MRPQLTHLCRLSLLVLMPVVSYAAPPPYWPAYPPTPYYYPLPPANPPLPATNPEREATATTEPPLTADSASGEATTGAEEATETKAAPLSQTIATAIQQGNFAEAYYLWRPLADEGDPDAQYGIGWMYHNGYGLAINDERAIEWWKRAAEQGHVDATFALGMLYGLGEGPVHRDLERAVDYYHQAARMGHEDARLLLRSLAIEGDPHARNLLLQLLADGDLLDIAKTVTVSAKKANVRKGPSTQQAIAIKVTEGQRGVALKQEGRWVLVGLEGSNLYGWIHDTLLGDKPPTPK